MKGEQNLYLEDLQFDLENYRIDADAPNQREAFARVAKAQDEKLAVLAGDIADYGLDPMQRSMVIESPGDEGKFIVLEGNRRLAALRTLENPAVIDGLPVSAATKRKLHAAAQKFAAGRSVTWPRPYVVMDSRQEAAHWIRLRHTGANDGAGTVDWTALQARRSEGPAASLDALDMVIAHGGLSEDQLVKVKNSAFPITTLERLLDAPAVREKLGVDVDSNNRLTSTLPPTEAIRGIRRSVLDLAGASGGNRTKVAEVMTTTDQNKYLAGIVGDLPDKTVAGVAHRTVSDFASADFVPAPAPSTAPEGVPGAVSGSPPAGAGATPSPPTPASGTPARGPGQPRSPTARASKALIPRATKLNVTQPKVRAIEHELRNLHFNDFPNAVGVLLRVFLEQSTDCYIERQLAEFSFGNSDWRKTKLKEKLEKTLEHMEKQPGFARRDYDVIRKALSERTHPLSPEWLNNYVHHDAVLPTAADLHAAWVGAEKFFKRIWP